MSRFMLGRQAMALMIATMLVAFFGSAGISVAVADEAFDPKDFEPTTGVLFWTPEQQRVGYRNMDRLFATRQISRAGAQPAPAYALPAALKDLSKMSFDVRGKRLTTAEYMEHNRVAGLLVIHRGRIVYERYALGHSQNAKWTSFSVAKSLTSMLTGTAIKDGYIKSVDEPVTTYLPLLKGTGYDGVTIKHVLQMSSGVAWNEDYADPKSDVAQIGTVAQQSGSLGLVRYMGKLKRVAKPGERFNYNTGETHLAGAIVRAAVGNNLSSYASQKIWSKLAMEADGYWMLADEFGAEHAGCCMSATLRDYGRIGMFALRKGVLPDGTAVLPENWMKDATTPSKANDGYGYQWWIFGPGSFAAFGIFGQSIHISEPEELVIVTHSLWPEATSPKYAGYRTAFIEAMVAAARKGELK